jgi:hypothetical protein
LDNRTAELSEWDADILAELAAGDGLVGLFTDQELSTLLPDFDSEMSDKDDKDISKLYEIVVECKDESEQETIFNNLTGQGYKCRILSI